MGDHRSDHEWPDAIAIRPRGSPVIRSAVRGENLDHLLVQQGPERVRSPGRGSAHDIAVFLDGECAVVEDRLQGKALSQVEHLQLRAERLQRLDEQAALEGLEVGGPQPMEERQSDGTLGGPVQSLEVVPLDQLLLLVASAYLLRVGADRVASPRRLGVLQGEAAAQVAGEYRLTQLIGREGCE